MTSCAPPPPPKLLKQPLKKTIRVPVDDRHPIESSEPSEGVEKPGHTEGCTQVLKTGYRLFPQERHATLRGCL